MKKILSFLTILVLLGAFSPQVFAYYVTDANNNRIYYIASDIGGGFLP